MITEFQGEFRFLSNFWPCRIEWNGHVFPSTEHAFVYAKTDLPEEQTLVLEACDVLNPGQIKRFGKVLTLRPNWNNERLRIMKELIRIKFQIPELKEKLLATETKQLVEGNSWGDVFWGVNLETGDGENNLGKILMEVRSELADS